MKTPFVSVIIPSYNSEAVIAQCLEKILEQSYPRNCYEVIVVDNASTDASAAIIKSFPVKYWYEARPGPAAARNSALKQARGEYILFIDADCLASRDLIANHIQAHRALKLKDPAVKVIGGGIGGINRNYWAWCDHYCSWYLNHPKLKPRFEEHHLPTANLSVNCSGFETRDWFDETMRYGEDSMFCKQAIQKGWKLYFAPEAMLYHINRTSWQGLMAHAKEWAQIGGYTAQKPPFKRVAGRNPLFLLLCNLVYFLIQFIKLCYSWIAVGDLRFWWCFPVIVCNKIYFGFHMLKARYGKLIGLQSKRWCSK